MIAVPPMPGVIAYGVAEGFRVARVDEGGVNTKAGERVSQQIVGAPVQRARRHDMGACAHQGHNGQVQGRLATGGGDSPDTAFQCGDALFQYCIGGITEA